MATNEGDRHLSPSGAPLGARSSAEALRSRLAHRGAQPHGRLPITSATISYPELARRAGRPGAPRAAGHANGANRICILVPCHRVVNKDGQLGGYGGR